MKTVKPPKLDLKKTIHVDHSTGGGEVQCYIARHEIKHFAKERRIGAVPPGLLKSAATTGGTAVGVLDHIYVHEGRTFLFLDLN